MTDLQSPPPNRLRVLRAERQWNQHQAARACGWSQSRYSLIETGNQPATPEDVEKLVEAFGVPASKIFPKRAA